MAGSEGQKRSATADISGIKNKVRRTKAFQDVKAAKNKEKREIREKRKKNDEPKQIPRTIESTREADETIVEPDDEEVIVDEMTDEFADYFNGRIPKILLTTSSKPVAIETFQFIKELKKTIPNMEFRERRNFTLKDIISFAKERSFTDVVVINEDKKVMNDVIISHLPDGPTAHYRLSSVVLHNDIPNKASFSSHQPELILNNFNTRLGHSVGRMLASLLPHRPEFRGRRVITFHNQRDFIFFRHHRYEFKNGKRAALQEIGPRFTLKLKSLQKGTFDSKFGEYEWMQKRGMETSRRRFFL